LPTFLVNGVAQVSPSKKAKTEDLVPALTTTFPVKVVNIILRYHYNLSHVTLVEANILTMKKFLGQANTQRSVVFFVTIAKSG